MKTRTEMELTVHTAFTKLLISQGMDRRTASENAAAKVKSASDKELREFIQVANRRSAGK